MIKKNRISSKELISIVSFCDDLIFFVGSAVSMYPPTNLPNGKELSINLFKGLTNKKGEDEYLLKFNKIFEKILDSNEEFGKIPLERIISYIGSIFNDEKASKDFFRSFDYFSKAKSNSIHKLLLDLTLKKRIGQL